MKPVILANLKRCTGCWTCSLACKMAHDLDVDEFRLVVRTIGSGAGIDEPAGQWPNLKMSWMPIWTKKCAMCTTRAGAGNDPYCVYNCPTGALTYGDADSEDNAVAKKSEELKALGFHEFKLPPFEDSRDNVTYITK
ncbi:MAG: hypothetical protein J6S36_05630 [Eggerthellaceae bacterium]|nr:hypothetical protein [Eggerthellaceae bacterium]